MRILVFHMQEGVQEVSQGLNVKVPGGKKVFIPFIPSTLILSLKGTGSAAGGRASARNRVVQRPSWVWNRLSPQVFSVLKVQMVSALSHSQDQRISTWERKYHSLPCPLF